jgi:SAM-dependent methyltransferase
LAEIEMLWKVARDLKPRLSSFYYRLSQPPVPNLAGDREVEYSWIAANMPDGPGKALDFGCGTSWLSLLAARRGFDVTAVDLTDVKWFYEHPHLKFSRGDLTDLALSPSSIDLIINCSSIEHVGLTGRYGITRANPDGDLAVMELLKDLIKPQKDMLLTIPVGQDHVFAPMHRVYGEGRLPQLLKGWDIIKSEYWGKSRGNQWQLWNESSALTQPPSDHYYGLGVYVLRRPE